MTRAAAATVSLTLHLPDAAVAAAVHAALAVEAPEGPEGAAAELRRDGAALHVRLEAPDLATLRAALHAVVRLLDAAQRTVQA